MSTIKREPGFSYKPTNVDEAKGVTILRAIGGERMALLDPLILLDHASIAAGSDSVGFPRHPHRGIETLSYVLEGEVGHKDSNGNEGTVGSNGSQWMVAGNGIYHEEMLISGPEGSEFLQLWFSLPSSQKRIPASYHGAPEETIAEVAKVGSTVRVIAGYYQGVEGAFMDIAVNPTVLDIQLSPSSSIEIPTKLGDALVCYLVRGALTNAENAFTAPELIVYTDGDTVEFVAGSEGARIFFVSARPLAEPILQYRSFVMNTVEDIRETVDLIESGNFAQ